MPRSIALAQSLNPKLVIPQHYDIFDPLLHLRRFQSLCLRAGIPPQP
jgi:L-ascorbate metabolism protein UlaG (beta-lactamase superfamily)